MNTSFKKIVAGATVVAVVAMNIAVVNAAVVFTGAITGGANTPTNINSDWDGISTPSGTTASGSDSVVVSAQVAPILTMAISTGALNFGTLALGANNQSLTLTTVTNADGGITVAMGSNGLQSPTKYIGAYGAAGLGQTTTTGNDSYKITTTSNGAGTDYAINDVAASRPVLTTANVVDSNQITTVDLTATIDAQTEAGNYGDTVTFTITGNF